MDHWLITLTISLGSQSYVGVISLRSYISVACLYTCLHIVMNV